MNHLFAVVAFSCFAGVTSAQATAASIEQREIHFYSEGVLCYGKLFLPIWMHVSDLAANKGFVRFYFFARTAKRE